VTWQNRVYKAVYIHPNGFDEFEFDSENVSRVTEKRTTAFQFPGVDDAYVQGNGFGSRKYALRCYFTGDDCDLLADRFEVALLFDGVGTLRHPLYGTFSVVPFGTVSRRDDLVTAANQAIVDVTFWTTTGVVYPTSQVSAKNEVEQNADLFEEATIEWYDNAIELGDEEKRARHRGNVEEQLAIANAVLSKPAEATAAVSREFRAWQQTINTGITTLVGNPVLLAQSVVNLVKAPARAAAGIENMILAYVDFLQTIFTSPGGTPGRATGISAREGEQIALANSWRHADLSALNGLVAMARAAIEADYRTKPEALSTADALLAQLEAVSAWREAGYAEFTSAEYGARIEVIDDGRAWLNATQTIYVCAGYLVQLAFSLSAERLTVLDRNRSIIDLCAEFYGNVDDETINFFIDSNSLCGCQILELERGTEVLWYPQ
jgi:prophage DNA circulation protein